ncbi:hypothetical protein FOZ63_020270, partial [Perkinsus olseni]
NPACTSVPEWFRKKYLNNPNNDKAEPVPSEGKTPQESPSSSTEVHSSVPGQYKRSEKPVYATIAASPEARSESLSALGFDALLAQQCWATKMNVLVHLHPEWERVDADEKGTRKMQRFGKERDIVSLTAKVYYPFRVLLAPVC